MGHRCQRRHLQRKVSGRSLLQSCDFDIIQMFDKWMTAWDSKCLSYRLFPALAGFKEKCTHVLLEVLQFCDFMLRESLVVTERAYFRPQSGFVLTWYFCFLQRFLQRFIDPTSREDENAGLDLNEPLYMQKLDEVKPDCE